MQAKQHNAWAQPLENRQNLQKRSEPVVDPKLSYKLPTTNKSTQFCADRCLVVYNIVNQVTKDIEIRQAVDACSKKAIVERITRYKIYDSAYKTKYG